MEKVCSMLRDSKYLNLEFNSLPGVNDSIGMYLCCGCRERFVGNALKYVNGNEPLCKACYPIEVDKLYLDQKKEAVVEEKPKAKKPAKKKKGSSAIATIKKKDLSKPKKED